MDRKPVSTPTRNVLSLKEYADTLTGSAKLVVAAMRLTHSNKKLTVEQWADELAKFGSAKA